MRVQKTLAAAIIAILVGQGGTTHAQEQAAVIAKCSLSWVGAAICVPLGIALSQIGKDPHNPNGEGRKFAKAVEHGLRDAREVVLGGEESAARHASDEISKVAEDIGDWVAGRFGW